MNVLVGSRAARCVDDPRSNPAYLVSLLSNWNEFRWGDKTKLAVLPAHKRLKPTSNVCVEIHDGLEKQKQLIFVNRCAQITLQAAPTHDLLIHVWMEDHKLIPARFLRFIESGVGIALSHETAQPRGRL